MRKCALLILATAILSLAFAPAPLPKPPKPPKVEDWLGMWDQVGSPTVTFEITATTMTYHNAGGAPSAYFLAFDAKKSPKCYEISSTRGGRVAFLGIWKVEGDLLTICYRGAGNPRPDAFDRVGGAHVETFKKKR